jgi:hypothetical protein
MFQTWISDYGSNFEDEKVSVQSKLGMLRIMARGLFGAPREKCELHAKEKTAADN